MANSGMGNADHAKEVQRVMQKQVADSTKSQYLGHQARFVCYVYDEHHAGGLVNAPFFNRHGLVKDNKGQCVEVRKQLKSDFVDTNLGCPPLVLSRLDANTVGQFIVWTNAQQGKKLGIDTVRVFLSAIKDLFRTYNVQVPAEYQREVDKLSRGYAKDNVSARKNTRGKEPLPFELFAAVSQKMLQASTTDCVFARTFLILQWNLMCRADNMEHLKVEHLGWRNDCLLVYFRKQKNDQDGSRSLVPRSVYANPVQPEVCSVLALGIFWMCFPPTSLSQSLFSGSAQAARFGAALLRILGSNADLLKEHGFVPEDFGTHSNRKGSATYVTSGTPDGPGQVPVNLRGGWTMKDVEKSYFQFERAGDQFVGRTVAGLPPLSEKFAMLPPMFRERTAEDGKIITEVLTACFPVVQTEEATPLLPILRQALASVVHHSLWLLSLQPKDHPLLQTPLFCGPHLEHLRQLVVCELPTIDGPMKATGVPRGVMTHLEIAQLREEQRALTTEIREFRGAFEETLNRGLNSFAVSQGHMTIEAFQSALRNQLDEFDARLARALKGPTMQDSASAASTLPPPQQQLYCWSGKFHLVPADFELPTTVSVQNAFILWASGNVSLGYPPFRMLGPDDMPTANMRKRFSDLKQLMRMLESEAERRAIWPNDAGVPKDKLTVDEAVLLFSRVADIVTLEPHTNKGRARRQAEMAWTTVYKAWKSNKFQERGASRKRARGASAREGGEQRLQMTEEDELQVGDDEIANGQAEIEESDGSLRISSMSSSESSGFELRRPEYDVATAYSALVQYCETELGLVEGKHVVGDGACVFRCASIQLQRVGQRVDHKGIRAACVEWVWGTYHGEDDIVLRGLGYDGWDGWKREMAKGDHYGDELCFEALANVYQVRVRVIVATHTISLSFRTPAGLADGAAEDLPVITIACVGDYHCYDFTEPKTQPRKAQKRK